MGGDDSEDHICRNCHEAGGDLIKPCQCSGSLAYVHRDCLNTWRSVSPNPHSFSHCDICNQPYYMRKKKLGSGPYIKMFLGMARDISLVLITVLAIIVIPGAVILGLQSATDIMHKLTSDSATYNAITSPGFCIFIWGAAFDCFIIGCCAIVYAGLKFTGRACRACCCLPIGSHATTYYTYNTYNYRSTIPAWWWWYVFLTPPRTINPCCCFCCQLDCLCHTCCHHNCSLDHCCDGRDCKCNNGGNALLYIIIAIIIVIILIGFVIGMIFLTVLTIRIINNHITILQKQKEAQELEVIDLSNGLAKDDPSVIVLNDTGFVNPYENADKEQQPLLSGPPVPVDSSYPQPQVMSAGAGPTAPPPDSYAPVPEAFVPVNPEAGDGSAAPSVPPSF